jgi:hypothetical protein
MIAAAILIVLLVLVVTIAVAGGLRRLVRDESEVERRLRAPETPTVSYAVPNGVDPADLRTALLRAGYSSTMSTAGTRQCLMIGCSNGDRARVRDVIEGVHETAYDGSDLVLRPVVFEDERHPGEPGVDSLSA